VFAVGEYILSLTVGGTSRDGTFGSREGFLVSLDSDGAFRWMATVHGGGFDSLDAVAPLADGSVCFVGRFEHPATFVDAFGDESSLTSVGSTAAMLGCVDSTGRRQFVERFGGTGISVFEDITVDDSSNLYVAGRFSGTVDFGSVLASRGGEDVVVASYRPDGTHQWSRHYGSSLRDRGMTLACRGANLYVGGTFNQTIDFGGGALTAPAAAAFLVNLDTDGNHVDSVAYGPASVVDLRVLSSGALAVAGGFDGATDLLGIDRDGSSDGYVAIVDDGWTASTVIQLEGPGVEAWRGIADLDGLLVFAGFYSAGAVFDGAVLPNRGSYDAILAGFDTDTRWHATFGGEGADNAWSAAEAGGDHVILGGRHAGGDFGGGTLDPGDGIGGVIAKYRVR